MSNHWFLFIFSAQRQIKSPSIQKQLVTDEMRKDALADGHPHSLSQVRIPLCWCPNACSFPVLGPRSHHIVIPVSSICFILGPHTVSFFSTSHLFPSHSLGKSFYHYFCICSDIHTCAHAEYFLIPFCF